MYKPKPIDTSGVQLPDELQPLVERLAEHVHENWSLQRIGDGWTHGEARDDDKKTHPGLVPYEKLPEAEKDYDRRTATETILALLAMGAQIEGIALETGRTAWSADELPADLTALRRLWNDRPENRAGIAPHVYCNVAQRMIKLGEPLLAYDVLDEGLEHHTHHVRMRQLMGLALDRNGVPHRANELLSQLYNEGNVDGETLGLLARTHKSLALQSGDHDHWRMALAFYEQGYDVARHADDHDGAYYNGINAATVALLTDDPARSAQRAGDVMKLCKRLADERGEDYWLVATRAEAALLTGDREQAIALYQRSAELAGDRLADLSSTRRQAMLILEKLGDDPKLAHQWMPIAPVAVYAGKLADAASPKLIDLLDRAGSRIGYADDNAGLMFLDAIHQRGGETHLVMRREVDDAQGPLLDAIQHAVAVYTAADRAATLDAATLDYADQMLLGLASLRARSLGAPLAPIAAGEKCALVDLCRRRGIDVDVITTDSAAPDVESEAAPGAELLAESSPRPGAGTRIMAMLFGDVKGFSKLNELQVSRFMDTYLGEIARVIDTSDHKPVTTNTWGDGLYFVFDSIHTAGIFALELGDAMNAYDLAGADLPDHLGLRIGLHAGPVRRVTDPITRQTNYTGTHVSRAARIEPITPPGHVYASQPFAALAEAHGVEAFQCDYVGQTPLAKGYGTFPTYHVRWC